jgi:GntR family transcriptional repressor for pyruvate dehydrogenase complex
MKNSARPIIIPKAYEVVRDRIIEMLENGEYREGDLLPAEVELAAKYQLSRSSIREAFKSLQLSGIVNSTPGKGTFVAPHALSRIEYIRLGEMMQDETNMTALAEARLMIEPEMAFYAAMRGEVEDIDAMNHSIQMMKQSTEKTELLTYGHQFHRAVCRATKNDVMIGMHNSISTQLYRMRLREELTIEVYKRGIGEHQEICDAIAEQDGKKASKLMREHLLRDYSRFLK